MRFRIRQHNQATAFTLLEVILALAILAGSVAVLGEVMGIAGRHSSAAHATTRAQILASSIMNEMVVGLTDPTEQTRQSLEVDDRAPWVYSVTLGTTNLSGLTVVEVLVEQDLEPQFAPIKFRLVRWLRTSTETEDRAEHEETGETDAEQDDA